MYPVKYEADYVQERKRWRTGFRFIVAIRGLLLGQRLHRGCLHRRVHGLVRDPLHGWLSEPLYDFNAGVIRFVARAERLPLSADRRVPPFAFEQAPDYPIRAPVDPVPIATDAPRPYSA